VYSKLSIKMTPPPLRVLTLLLFLSEWLPGSMSQTCSLQTPVISDQQYSVASANVSETIFVQMLFGTTVCYDFTSQSLNYPFKTLSFTLSELQYDYQCSNTYYVGIDMSIGTMSDEQCNLDVQDIAISQWLAGLMNPPALWPEAGNSCCCGSANSHYIDWPCAWTVSFDSIYQICFLGQGAQATYQLTVEVDSQVVKTVTVVGEVLQTVINAGVLQLFLTGSAGYTSPDVSLKGAYVVMNGTHSGKMAPASWTTSTLCSSPTNKGWFSGASYAGLTACLTSQGPALGLECPWSQGQVITSNPYETTPSADLMNILSVYPQFSGTTLGVDSLLATQSAASVEFTFTLNSGSVTPKSSIAMVSSLACVGLKSSQTATFSINCTTTCLSEGTVLISVTETTITEDLSCVCGSPCLSASVYSSTNITSCVLNLDGSYSFCSLVGITVHNELPYSYNTSSTTAPSQTFSAGGFFQNIFDPVGAFSFNLCASAACYIEHALSSLFSVLLYSSIFVGIFCVGRELYRNKDLQQKIKVWFKENMPHKLPSIHFNPESNKKLQAFHKYYRNISAGLTFMQAVKLGLKQNPFLPHEISLEQFTTECHAHLLIQGKQFSIGACGLRLIEENAFPDDHTLIMKLFALGYPATMYPKLKAHFFVEDTELVELVPEEAAVYHVYLQSMSSHSISDNRDVPFPKCMEHCLAGRTSPTHCSICQFVASMWEEDQRTIYKYPAELGSLDSKRLFTTVCINKTGYTIS
jgi:hypothetical protein